MFELNEFNSLSNNLLRINKFYVIKEILSIIILNILLNHFEQNQIHFQQIKYKIKTTNQQKAQNK